MVVLFVGEGTLSGKYDVVRVELQPSEQYKSVCKTDNLMKTLTSEN